jgi:hypothetical protein
MGDLADLSQQFERAKELLLSLIEIHAAEPIVPEHSPFEVEIAVTNLKINVTGQILIIFWQN